MKTFLVIIVVVIAFSSCTTKSESFVYDNELILLVDETDTLLLYPTAEDIIRYLGVNTHIWSGSRIEISYLTDRDINETTVISIPRENFWMSSQQIREAKVKHFEATLHAALDSLPLHPHFLHHSIINRSVTYHLNKLTQTRAAQKSCFIYSNMLENQVLSFYNPTVQKKLRNNPDEIADTLLQACPLEQLSGIRIFLLYKPRNYGDNQLTMPGLSFYRNLWQKKGAAVEIGANLSTP